MHFLHGAARKVSLPILGLAAVGWIVFVVGFGGFNNDDTFYNDIRQGNHTFTPNKDFSKNPVPFPESEEDIEEDFPVQRADPDFFPHWCYMISFPFLFTILILHLVLHSFFIFGVIGHLLLGLNLVCGAGAFWITGSRLFSADNNFQNEFGKAPNGVDILPDDWLTQRYYGLWLVVEWVGVTFCLLMLVVFVMLIPLYTAPCSKTKAQEPVEDHELETKEPESPLPAPQAAE